jgi:hypothetical protein
MLKKRNTKPSRKRQPKKETLTMGGTSVVSIKKTEEDIYNYVMSREPDLLTDPSKEKAISAHDLGLQQFAAVIGESSQKMILFTEQQIKQMFTLAIRLSDLGVTHANLTLREFRYHPDSKRFTFASLGKRSDSWSQRVMKCDFSNNLFDAVTPYFNVWQLLVALSNNYAVVFIETDKEIRILLGLGPDFARVLPKEVIQKIEQICPGFDQRTWEERRQEKMARSKLMQSMLPFWL